MSPQIEQVLNQLRTADDAHQALARFIAALGLEPPTVYHVALAALQTKRGVLQSQIDQGERARD